MSDILWWAYRHIDGSLHAKRYFSEEDIAEAKASPFVATVAGPTDTKEKALFLLGEKGDKDAGKTTG